MRVTCRIWRAWAALAIALTVCAPAHAFYFPGWPGSRLRIQESPIITPTTPGPGQPPPEIPVRNQPPDKPPVGPNPTPEPSTGLIGLVGLGALAAARRWRKQMRAGVR